MLIVCLQEVPNVEIIHSITFVEIDGKHVLNPPEDAKIVQQCFLGNGLFVLLST
jgi:hypothetical protein